MAEVEARSSLVKIFRVDPEKAWNEIQKIRHANGGVASPRAIVDAAREPRSPRHKAFEWDDSKAAEKYREHFSGEEPSVSEGLLCRESGLIYPVVADIPVMLLEEALPASVLDGD